MTCHATKKFTENDKMQHPVDGKAWKNFDNMYPGLKQKKIRQRYIEKDPSSTDELFALACGPSLNPILVNSYIVNGVRFIVHIRDERHTTQNNDICLPGEKDGEMYYVEALPDIIPVDADDDFIDDEDDVPYDLVDYDDEVLANADDYDDEAATVVFLMSAAITRDHGGDGGGNDLSRPVRLASVFEEAEKPRQGRRQGWMKEGGAEFPMHYLPGAIEASKKAHIKGRLMQHFDLNEHMLGPHWRDVETEIEQHFTKVYSDNKNALKRKMQTDENHEYSSLISSFCDTHTYEGVWAQRRSLPDFKRNDQVKGYRSQYAHRGALHRGGDTCPSHKGQAKQRVGSGSGSGGGADDYEDGDEDVDGMMTRVISIYSYSVTLGVDDMSSGKVFPILTLVDLVNTFPTDMSSGKRFSTVDFVRPYFLYIN
ncbi:hypothetical protein Tco_0898924 [Tanacetum coccineum]